MFQEGLHTFIATAPSIKALVGEDRGDSTDGIFYMLAVNEPIMPYMTFQRVAGRPSQSLDGAGDLQATRWRFSCYGASQGDAVRLAKALKNLFKKWTGTFDDGTMVQNVLQEFEADDTESMPHSTVFASHVDFAFMYVDAEDITSP